MSHRSSFGRTWSPDSMRKGKQRMELSDMASAGRCPRHTRRHIPHTCCCMPASVQSVQPAATPAYLHSPPNTASGTLWRPNPWRTITLMCARASASTFRYFFPSTHPQKSWAARCHSLIVALLRAAREAPAPCENCGQSDGSPSGPRLNWRCCSGSRCASRRACRHCQCRTLRCGVAS